MAGKTVEEATEQALDQLGVAVGDAEVIVVDEPKTGLFGRVRVEARVRARVRPVGARPRRERSRRSGSGGRARGVKVARASRQGGQRSPRRVAAVAAAARERGLAPARPGSAGRHDGSGHDDGGNGQRHQPLGPAPAQSQQGDDHRPWRRWKARGTARGGRRLRRLRKRSTEAKETEDMAEGMTLEEQGEVGRAFVADLLSEFGMEGTVETRLLDEDTVEIAALGEDLGILVGPRGSTLAALQDLTRAVVQRQCPSRTDRILVDVAGYRERRSAALKRFSVQIAEEVLASGQEKALEPMSPADRKAVHDAINEMAGVETRSEGEDPNRHIVIAPAG